MRAARVKTTCSMKLIILQSTAMLRIQTAHNVDTFLYLFHIGDECLPGAGYIFQEDNPDQLTCAGQVKFISN